MEMLAKWTVKSLHTKQSSFLSFYFPDYIFSNGVLHMATFSTKPSVVLLGNEAVTVSQKLQLSLIAQLNQGILIGTAPQVTRRSQRVKNDPTGLHGMSLTSFYPSVQHKDLFPAINSEDEPYVFNK